MFLDTLIRVLALLAYAVPGYIFIKIKALKEESIPAFAKLLLYVCSPCLAFYSFSKAEYSEQMHTTIWISLGITLGLLVAVVLLARILLHRLNHDIRWRIFMVATALGNLGFFGIPLLEHFLPEYPYAPVFSQVFSLSMNLMAWTIGLFFISQDKKYLKIRKLLTVPILLVMIPAYPMFLFGWTFPPIVEESIELLGRMSTPLCMIILGMRLATVKIKEMITDWRSLLAALSKTVLFPIFAFFLLFPIPLDPYVKATIFLLACCPCASMIQSLSELIGQGQKQAANVVLISTIVCIVTIPILSEIFLPFIF